MSFLPSPKPSAVDSGRRKRGLGAKDRRQTRFPLLVMQLEERQVLTTPTVLSISASASNLVAGSIEVFTATAVTNPPDGTNVPTGGTVTFSNGSCHARDRLSHQRRGVILDHVAARYLLGNGIVFRSWDVCE